MNKRIRILYVLPLGGIGGAEKYVSFLCRHHDKGRFNPAVCILFSGGETSNQIASDGANVTVLNMKNGFDLFKALRLVHLIRKQNIDIINIHGQAPLGKFCSIISCPPLVVHTDHGTSINSPVKRKKRVIYFNRLLSPFIKHFIAISNGMKKSLRVREWVPSQKITLIYNGIDVEAISKTAPDKAALRKSLGIPANSPVLGTVGRLAPEKQFSLLLRSLSILKSQKVKYTALIIGDGPEKRALEALAQEMDINEQVRFLGERNDVFQLLDLLDVFVFSSGGEGFPLSILEAMAKAKPIVGFYVDGVREAVISEETGYLVPFGDTEAFARQVRNLLVKPELSRKMGKAGFKRVETEFNAYQNIRKLESLYEELLKLA